jgi:hypothetical protein
LEKGVDSTSRASGAARARFARYSFYPQQDA